MLAALRPNYPKYRRKDHRLLLETILLQKEDRKKKTADIAVKANKIIPKGYRAISSSLSLCVSFRLEEAASKAMNAAPVVVANPSIIKYRGTRVELAVLSEVSPWQRRL